jgi:ubiquinone/menaquinone biosynthesis C-methylase UbiE
VPSRKPGASPRERLLGRTLNNLVVRAPWAWPLIRGPMAGFFTKRARGWDERTGAGSVAHLAPLAAAVLEVPRSPERVLEIGCGTGEATLFLAREFPQARVRGVDISAEMVRVATDKVGLDPEGRIAFKVGDAAALPYPESYFDLVAQLNMPPFFDQIARVLRPGGHVVVAASWGARTPFFTSERVLRWKFAQYAIETVATGEAGEGTYFVGASSA